MIVLPYRNTENDYFFSIKRVTAQQMKASFSLRRPRGAARKGCVELRGPGWKTLGNPSAAGPLGACAGAALCAPACSSPLQAVVHKDLLCSLSSDP